MLSPRVPRGKIKARPWVSPRGNGTQLLRSPLVIATRLKTWLLSPRIPGVAVAIACLFALPSLRLGLAADDFFHRAMVRQNTGWTSPTALYDIFTFVSGRPDDFAHGREIGLEPWWTAPELRIALFRPLPSLLHALDYSFWPTTPAIMHAESIAWYALVVYLAARLFQRLLPPLAAGIATLFYAVDPTHGIPVGWVANRNALVAATFALATLLLHDTGARRERLGPFPFAAAASLALALASGEGALATLAYLAAYGGLLDPRPLRARLLALLPSAVVVVGWAFIYRLGRYGAHGSGVYLDALGSPRAGLESLVTHLPLLLGSELGGPSPDAYPLVEPTVRITFVVVALIFVAWAAAVIVRMLRAAEPRVRRVAAFFALAGVLATAPSTPTFPSGRLLVLPGFALVGLLALVCAGALERASWAAPRFVRAYAAWSWLVHAALAPLLFAFTLHAAALLSSMMEKLADGIPSDGSTAARRLVLVNAPDTAFAYYLVIFQLEAGRSPPTRLLTMTGNLRDVRITRTGERSFVVHEDGGFYRSGSELLFRDFKPAMTNGQTIALSDVTITVTHVMNDGVPDEASFELARDVESGYVWRAWTGKDLVPFTPPAIGETVTFPARRVELL